MILRKPTKEDLQKSQMAQYLRWLPQHGYPHFSQYQDLYQWSVTDVESFWESIWKWGNFSHQGTIQKVLSSPLMPGAKWFEGIQLNFAENLLSTVLHSPPQKVVMVSVYEDGTRKEITSQEFLSQISSFSSFLKSEGVGVGDRVAAVTSHTFEPIIAMLATTSIGGIWSSCSADFGVQGIVDRLGQIQPKILLTVNGYTYNGKPFVCVDRISEVCRRIPSIQKTVVISQLSSTPFSSIPQSIAWEEVLKTFSKSTPPTFVQGLAFDHPVYILFTSGTTGVPKCIVHGAGGTLLQHKKELVLHTNIGPSDRFFYFTTTGWMMWNWLVSGLMTGAQLLLYEGSPSFPDLGRLWKMAQEEGMTVFGTSAKFLGSCRNANLKPNQTFDLSFLRTILSTGSPLLPEDFDWVYQQVKKDVLLSSISGGTDIVSCFLLGNPMLPVYRGELQCRGLGMAVKAFSSEGKEILGQQGELVCTKPAPSMPVCFWNDPDGKKYEKAYFEHFPGIWRHGDFIEFKAHGGAIIYGRSDATLNPSGVRIGTAEIYRQVETLSEVQDTIVVGQPWGGDERILLFVVLKPGYSLTLELEKKIKKKIREETSPRHVPAKILAVQEIPYTINGKKTELAVAKILKGEKVENREALVNPKSLDLFAVLKESLQKE